MEVMHFPSPSNSMDGHLTAAYLSCPTSPSGVSFVGSPQFFSAPSSPTRGLTADPFAFEAAAEKAKQGATESDDFEFEIGFELSQRFVGDSVQKKHEDRPPQPEGEEAPPANMAFADELFSNGLVLPLKLPPRLQSPTYGTSHLRSSSSLVIRGGSSASGFSFKKDFDPFEAALEKVRKEEPEWSPPVAHRRARSLSPRSHSYQYWAEQPANEAPHQIQDPDPLPSIVEPPKGSAFPEPDKAPESEKPAERPVVPEPEKPVKGKPTRSKSEKVTERGKERRPSGPTRSSSERPATATATNAPESAAQHMEKVTVKKASFFRKGSKRQMIKDFLFRSASEGRVDSKDKLRARTAAIHGSAGPKDLSFGSAHGVLYKGSDEARKKKNTTMAYKPSALFECLRMKDQKKKKN